jgi:hypothetical protein
VYSIRQVPRIGSVGALPTDTTDVDVGLVAGVVEPLDPHATVVIVNAIRIPNARLNMVYLLIFAFILPLAARSRT